MFLKKKLLYFIFLFYFFIQIHRGLKYNTVVLLVMKCPEESNTTADGCPGSVATPVSLFNKDLMS